MEDKGCEPKEATKTEQIYQGLCNAEERRRELIKGIAEKVSLLLPIASSPCGEKEDSPQKSALGDIIGKVNNLHNDNDILTDILNTLRKII